MSPLPNNNTNTADEVAPAPHSTKVQIKAPAPHSAALAVFLISILANPSCVVATWLYTYLYADTWTPFDIALYTILPRTLIVAYMHWLDVTAFDGFNMNVKIAEVFGYSRTYVVSNAVMLILSAHWGFPVLIMSLLPAAQPHFDLAFLARVLVCCAAYDVLFRLAHATMHRHLPSTHILHHCDLFPCMTSGVVMSPIDAMFNTMPLVMIVATLTTDLIPFMKDPFALVVFLTIFVANATIDHDAWVQTRHTGHHARIDSDYYFFSDVHIWRKTTRRDADDQVRNIIFDAIEVDRSATRKHHHAKKHHDKCL